MKKAGLRSRNATSNSALRKTFVLIPFLLLCCWFGHRAQAVSPTPDGGYPGGNTAEGGSGALFSLTTGSNNTALGSQALQSVTTGSQNTATGAQALKDNVASQNTADGFQALSRNNSGDANTATGWRALFTNTTGDRNSADGNGALYRNTVGSDNTATGFQALYNNSTGSGNTAYGSQALLGGGNDNTAIGADALANTPSTNRNTAIGTATLNGIMVGGDNTATGFAALECFNGSSNTAVGSNALVRCRDIGSGSGDNNTAIGAGAFSSGDSVFVVQNNTVIGAQALPLPEGPGNNNIAIGYQAGMNLPFGDNNIEIGNAGEPAGEEGPTIRIGDVQTRAFIAGIRGVTTGSADAIPVVRDSTGQLGTMSSSQRYKHEIKPMDRASEAILALKPVTFEYKSDKTKTPQFGLIAEQVAKVNPDLIVRDEKGEIYSVRYDAVNAMLLNEFLKAHRKVEEQGGELQKQAAMIAQQQKQIKALTEGLQNVNAPLKLGHPPPQIVGNP